MTVLVSGIIGLFMLEDFNKNDDKVRKINAYCNHPPVILNKIQKSIFKRMINSCNQINFNQTAPF